MLFEWDEVKNKINIRKHGIDFEDVKGIFNHPVLSFRDTSHVYEEGRTLDRYWLDAYLDGGCGIC